jgi:hypothetical protein
LPLSEEAISMRKTLIAFAAATMAATTAAPAAADPPPWAPAHGKRANEARRNYQTSNGIQYWNGDDGRRYCRLPDGTTGLIVGAAAGALAGREIDTRGERATGTILGAAAGALLGREVERNVVSCR